MPVDSNVFVSPVSYFSLIISLEPPTDSGNLQVPHRMDYLAFVFHYLAVPVVQVYYNDFSVSQSDSKRCYLRRSRFVCVVRDQGKAWFSLEVFVSNYCDRCLTINLRNRLFYHQDRYGSRLWVNQGCRILDSASRSKLNQRICN